jgi:3-isopropylmalate/(R)-2-methylmalate dehydratase small subunit
MKETTMKGRVAFVFEQDDFDVDQIVGVENIKIKDVPSLVAVAMRDYDPTFVQTVQPGDFLVGATNFGYGHPHYPPMIAMRAMGIAGVIAESFSPGYWRGEIAMGFPQFECPGIQGLVQRWDELTINLIEHTITNQRTAEVLPFTPWSLGDEEMLRCGGIVPYLHHRK